MRLNRQVLQIASNIVTSEEVPSSNSNHFLSRLTRVEFLKFWGRMFRGGSTSVTNFLRLMLCIFFNNQTTSIRFIIVIFKVIVLMKRI